jgi:hypothetical protein
MTEKPQWDRGREGLLRAMEGLNYWKEEWLNKYFDKMHAGYAKEEKPMTKNIDDICGELESMYFDMRGKMSYNTQPGKQNISHQGKEDRLYMVSELDAILKGSAFLEQWLQECNRLAPAGQSVSSLDGEWLMRLLAKQADEKLKEKSDVC